MSSPTTLKNYLKQEIEAALGTSIEGEDFDKIMGAFANAIDRYLKQDVKVAIDIEAKGNLDISNAFPVPVGGAQTVYEVETKTTTEGKLT